MKRLILAAALCVAALPAFATSVGVVDRSGAPAGVADMVAPVCQTGGGAYAACNNGQLVTAEIAGTTSATAGTFTVALPASSSRHGGVIQNTSAGTLYVFFGAGAASLTNTFQVASGQSLNLNLFGGGVLTDQVQVAGSLASQTYVVATQ